MLKELLGSDNVRETLMGNDNSEKVVLEKSKTRFAKFYDKYEFEITDDSEMRDLVIDFEDEIGEDYRVAAGYVEDAFEEGEINKEIYRMAMSALGVQQKINTEDKRDISNSIKGYLKGQNDFDDLRTVLKEKLPPEWLKSFRSNRTILSLSKKLIDEFSKTRVR